MCSVFGQREDRIEYEPTFTQCEAPRAEGMWVAYGSDPGFITWMVKPPWLFDFRDQYVIECQLQADLMGITETARYSEWQCIFEMGCWTELSCCFNPNDLDIQWCDPLDPYYFERMDFCNDLPGYYWNDHLCACVCNKVECPISPIIISPHGQSVKLTDAAGGVLFDINGDGIKEQISWTSIDSDAGFLALDRNQNGMIDDGTELFGNFTLQPPSLEKNGFLALAVFDIDGNGFIDEIDEIFSSLLVWTDANHDGVSQQMELANLFDENIDSIDLEYRESKRKDEYGNEFVYISRVYEKNKKGKQHLFAIDVFLTRQF